MIEKIVKMVLVAAMGLGSAVLISAQDEHPVYEAEATIDGIAGSATYRMTGDEMPRYYIVRNFFFMVGQLIADSGDAYFNMLKALAIEPGSEAAELLLAATLEAEAIAKIPTIRPDLEPSEIDAFQTAANRRKASELGQLYSQLLANLANVSYDIAGLENYMNQNVRPNTFAFSDRDDLGTLFSIGEVFEEAMSR